MGKSIYEQFDTMIEKAALLPNGWNKINAFEQAVQFAEDKNEYELSYYGRLYLSDASYSFGVFQKLVHSFFWCVHVYDQNKGVFDPYDLLWQYKWILTCFDKSPSVSTEEIQSVFDDMRQKYEAEGKSLRPYYQHLSSYYGRLGNQKEENRYFRLYQETEFDDMSDCQLCESQFEMMFFLSRKNYEKALQRATLILAKQETCNEVPHRTYAAWLQPLLEQGNVKQAREFHEKGYFLIRDNPLFLFELSQHLFFLSVTNLKQALRLFERHLSLAEESYNFHDKFHFYLASWFMLEQADKQRIFTAHSKEAFQQMTIEIASLFDERNGNTTYGAYIQTYFAYETKKK